MAEHVGILGAGLMGTGVAAAFASAGVGVVLQDIAPNRLAAVPGHLRRIGAALHEAGLVNADEETAIVERVHTTPRLADLADMPWVLEAVPERMPMKQDVYRALEGLLDVSATIASNTSGLMPSALAEGMRRPERFLVAHFWNPPFAIPLVEVVPGPATDPGVLDQTVALLARVGQTPVVIRKELPGFIGNRLQYALLREALAIVRSGAASAEDVDMVMRASLGRRLGLTGPLETADLGGLDTFLSIAEHLMPALAKDEGVLDLLRERVNAGAAGARAGQGFYPWSQDRLDAVTQARDRELLRLRLHDMQQKQGNDDAALA